MSETQTFPPLDSATEAALRESIRRFGVIVPVVLDQHGRIIDGHHRTRLAGEEGIELPTRVREVADDDELRDLAATLNLDRRHLPTKRRREIVAALRSEGHSLRAIAGAVGVDDKTVRNDIAGADMSAPAEVTGQDGKSYPATRAPRDRIDDGTKAEVARQLRAGSGQREIAQALGIGTATVHRIARDLKTGSGPGAFRSDKKKLNDAANASAALASLLASIDFAVTASEQPDLTRKALTNLRDLRREIGAATASSKAERPPC